MNQLQALIITLVVELAMAGLLLGWRSWHAASGRGAAAVVGASLLTHPIAWWVNGLGFWPFAARAAVIELAVVAVEAAALAWALRLPARRALLVSAAMNAASFAAGLILA